MNLNVLIFLQSLWILLPGAIANGAPVVAEKVFPLWLTPMDFGLKIRGKRLFGEHKTIRGLLSGIFVAITVSYVLSVIKKLYLADLPLLDYSTNTVLYGLASGCGALFGDALKSTVKRQLNIPPGKSWFPFDQIDWILGIIIVYKLAFGMNFPTFIVTLITGILVHLLGRLLGYLIGLNKEAI